MNGRIAKRLRDKATVPFAERGDVTYRFMKKLYKKFKKEYKEGYHKDIHGKKKLEV